MDAPLGFKKHEILFSFQIFLLDENLTLLTQLNIFSAHFTTRDLVTGGVMS